MMFSLSFAVTVFIEFTNNRLNSLCLSLHSLSLCPARVTGAYRRQKNQTRPATTRPSVDL